MLNYVEFDFKEKKGEDFLPPRKLQYTVVTAHALEDAAGCGISQLLQGQQKNVTAMVLLTAYGLHHADVGMGIKQAEKLIQNFITRGGDTGQLFKALVRAANRSGVYGSPDEDDEEEDLDPNAAGPASSVARPGSDDPA